MHPLVTARAVDRAFDYAIPAELGDRVVAGAIVRVPLGGREVDGVVDSLGEASGDDELKPIIDVTGRVTLPLLELAGWIAEQTASTMARAIALVIPPRPPRRALRAVERQVTEDRIVTLNEAQQRAVDECLAAIRDGSHEVLLHGVTGSGKTEVYLRVIEKSLVAEGGDRAGARDRAHAADRRPFRGPLRETVAVLHSALTPARRGEEHRRIAAGEARVVVGARSAIFAAVPDLGVIVVDEEHDASYKHESDPRYDARRVAAKRARLEGALVIFGSATPRPESWHGIARRISCRAGWVASFPRCSWSIFAATAATR